MSLEQQTRTRIRESLAISQTGNSKQFWYGFLVALVDHKLITDTEYRSLRGEVMDA